jgi:excisionase family DNA binding protein
MDLTQAAGYLRVSSETLVDLAKRGQIPGRELNGEWRFLRRAIDGWLSTQAGAPGVSHPSSETRKKFAGAFKDDPFLSKIVKDAYQERGRPIPEGDE